ncbi:NirD/YgiW/YdeI family stress tolerance protein [Marinomonas ostreistagni]|uniref:NirD/YgiW/YdeI family stress tolerance protein n=1 Tax=Marinomonas ostreistagni TaxID=359209 RepID=UPI0019508A30|nr:NirD/YgiW/YdeI family stress tolerance protein [Marinomonas ostreistagni]MBM6549809.1 NirD/YgiW/YdeI family stress tolerance protein [Marinomonas ostreistagni]
MKKLLLTTTLMAASTMSMAATDMKVSEALDARDDSIATLTGTLGKSLGHERYEFSDDSGTMVVEIDRDISRHIDLKSGQDVTLYGEIEREHDGNELEVDFLKVN